MTVRPGARERSGLELDLVAHPFTQPDSRLVVYRERPDAPIRIATAAYERRLADSIAIRSITFISPGGTPVLEATGTPASIAVAGGASMVMADGGTLSVEIPAGWELGTEVEPGASVDRRDETIDEAGIRRVLISIGSAVPDALPNHAALLADAESWWSAWFERRPPVRADLAATADLCWWTLAANRIRLPGDLRSVVAPSKCGYVAGWQWDSYFIAVGLRHGDPELAWDQLAFFLDHGLPDGQLPDVISDDGAIYRVSDLPPDEIGSDPLDVPVTKPPLAAWATWLVAEAAGRRDRAAARDRLEWALPRLEALQRWWTTRGDPDRDGLSEYGHRYSSGLDDSPLFDLGTPVASPDLDSYLAVADGRMAAVARLLGRPDDAAAHESEAAARVGRLVERRWDEKRGLFRCIGPAGADVLVVTPFGAMPLLTGRLPAHVIDRLIDTLHSPAGLWTAFPLPTVAPAEPTFDGSRMWRGPVWLNVNRLLVEGLRVSGRPELADELRERSLDLVVRSGGPFEHWDPLTGLPAGSATSMFSWSAALFIDLAVEASAT